VESILPIKPELLKTKILRYQTTPEFTPAISSGLFLCPSVDEGSGRQAEVRFDPHRESILE
jgi:hypothetical protein